MQGNGILSPPSTTKSLGAVAEAYAYCRRITRQSSSNFYYAFHLLSTDQHNALCALYAFCRFMDDIADHEEERYRQKLDKEERLMVLFNAWREELVHCYRGFPQHPISQALTDALQRFPIRQETLAGIIDGVTMDLHRNRYNTFSELYDYCYHVASLVGLACIEIFGYQNPATRDYAINLGIACQLTNILRDVAEDARQDRIYLPLQDLQRFGYAEDELRAGVYNDAFLRLMQFESERAKGYYRKALAQLAPEDLRTQAAAEAMRLIYSCLLDTLESRQFRVFGTRIQVPAISKVRLALTAWARSRWGVSVNGFGRF